MQLLIAAVHWKGEEMLSETLLTYVVHGIERSNTEQRLVLALKVVIVVSRHIPHLLVGELSHWDRQSAGYFRAPRFVQLLYNFL